MTFRWRDGALAAELRAGTRNAAREPASTGSIAGACGSDTEFVSSRNAAGCTSLWERCREAEGSRSKLEAELQQERVAWASERRMLLGKIHGLGTALCSGSGSDAIGGVDPASLQLQDTQSTIPELSSLAAILSSELQSVSPESLDRLRAHASVIGESCDSQVVEPTTTPTSNDIANCVADFNYQSDAGVASSTDSVAHAAGCSTSPDSFSMLSMLLTSVRASGACSPDSPAYGSLTVSPSLLHDIAGFSPVVHDADLLAMDKTLREAPTQPRSETTDGDHRVQRVRALQAERNVWATERGLLLARLCVGARDECVAHAQDSCVESCAPCGVCTSSHVAAVASEVGSPAGHGDRCDSEKSMSFGLSPLTAINKSPAASDTNYLPEVEKVLSLLRTAMDDATRVQGHCVANSLHADQALQSTRLLLESLEHIVALCTAPGRQASSFRHLASPCERSSRSTGKACNHRDSGQQPAEVSPWPSSQLKDANAGSSSSSSSSSSGSPESPIPLCGSEFCSPGGASFAVETSNTIATRTSASATLLPSPSPQQPPSTTVFPTLPGTLEALAFRKMVPTPPLQSPAASSPPRRSLARACAGSILQASGVLPATTVPVSPSAAVLSAPDKSIETASLLQASCPGAYGTCDVVRMAHAPPRGSRQPLGRRPGSRSACVARTRERHLLDNMHQLPDFVCNRLMKVRAQELQL